MYATPFPPLPPLPNPASPLEPQLITVEMIGFLSSSWHITSKGMFAGSCIGVIVLVMSLEFLRRLGREYDAFIVHRARLRAKYMDLDQGDSVSSSTARQGAAGAGAGPSTECCPNANGDNNIGSSKTPQQHLQPSPSPLNPLSSAGRGRKGVRPTPIEQTVRALLHMVQFAVAYFVMLLAMYFNGYIIICIFIGAFLGAMMFSWEEIGGNNFEYVMCPFLG